MKITYALVMVALFGGFSAAADDAPAARTKSPDGAQAYIISPQDGATVTGPVTVLFGLKGMGVAPAGPAGTFKANTGHFHLLVDAELPPADKPFPSDAQHIHFGGGQIQTTLTLSPGRHTLQLLLGDAAHMSFDPPVVSEKITITVK
jgi:hypothetical protein